MPQTVGSIQHICNVTLEIITRSTIIRVAEMDSVVTELHGTSMNEILKTKKLLYHVKNL
jgi:hypothetical protein